ncbi:hypothetical protein PHMEG_0003912 [Phytophthora megakarya]|uniref:Uncharacterized protein n=1 Tax=Phytophthora megakarya TaxID=4795 RepID=A0A225WV95_9STRA|nr:hypothetical protein PHMEG_0003912 [Phytophthora megakarya]
MEIVAVDRRLLQPAAVDEDETEAVAISCVEFLLSETNAYYQQKCLAHEAISSVSTRVRDNVLDTVFAAVLDAEVTMDEHGFRPESRPEAATQDRHAVRSVPSKSPEKPASTRNNFQNKPASSPPSRAGSLPDNLRSRAGTKKRGQITKVETDKPSAITPSIQTFEREFEMDCEKPEIKEWREKCLKMLAASKKKPGFSKLAAIARAFAVPENRVSMEVGVIAAPPENIVEALAETPVNMKTNVDSFASILDLTTEVENSSRVIENGNISIAMRRTTRKPGAALDSTSRNLRSKSTTIHSIAENPRRQSKRRSQSSNVSDTSLQQPRKSTILTDSLSRRKQTRKLSLSESLSGNSDNGWNSSRSLWNYEQESGSATTRTFVAEDSDFNTNSFPETMHVACGVVLLQGEFVVEGPGWGENSTTMSRRRFGVRTIFRLLVYMSSLDSNL